VKHAELNLGIGPVVAQTWAPDAVASLLDIHPQVDVNVKIYDFCELAPDLVNQTVELAIGEVIPDIKKAQRNTCAATPGAANSVLLQDWSPAHARQEPDDEPDCTVSNGRPKAALESEQTLRRHTRVGQAVCKWDVLRAASLLPNIRCLPQDHQSKRQHRNWTAGAAMSHSS
jgi:DNA-binding transcriptional LysR family regulator